MGWAARAREASEQLESSRYRVRRWTAFAWSGGQDRKDQEQHLERMASMIEGRLVGLYRHHQPSVKLCRIKREPQLVFEMTVAAADKDSALATATRHFDRALVGKLPMGPRRRSQLPVVWGKHEVEGVASQ